ncbi:hypothetical protein KY317_01545 [Candidatus Woesearchaeota archaeon]|nr:hypothetical protein [Candidatus Woesearchaeota archaeon]
MKKRDFKWASLLKMIGVFSVFFILFLTGCQNCENCPEAMLNLEMNNWFVNSDNRSQLFFETELYNYGSVEAEDVVLKCELYDLAGEIITSATKQVDSIPAESFIIQKVKADSLIVDYAMHYLGVCDVVDCSNCKLIHVNGS